MLISTYNTLKPLHNTKNIRIISKTACSGIKRFSNKKQTGFVDQSLGPSVKDLSTAGKYIEGNIKKFDWVTYLSGYFQPKEIKRDYHSIYWFNKELSRIVDNTREPSLGLGKLDFWKESIENIYKDQPTQEPVSICLHQAAKNSKINKKLLLNLIEAKKNEIENPEVPNYLNLEERGQIVRTTLILMHLKMLRFDFRQHPELITVAEFAGRSLGVLDYIKTLPHDMTKYRLRMPQDICSRHSVSIRNLWDRVHGRPKEELYDVILEVATYARENMFEAIRLSEKLPPQAHRALLHLVEAEYFFEELERQNFDIFDKTFHKNNAWTVPLRMRKASNKGKYFNGDLQSYFEDKYEFNQDKFNKH